MFLVLFFVLFFLGGGEVLPCTRSTFSFSEVVAMSHLPSTLWAACVVNFDVYGPYLICDLIISCVINHHFLDDYYMYFSIIIIVTKVTYNHQYLDDFGCHYLGEIWNRFRIILSWMISFVNSWNHT